MAITNNVKDWIGVLMTGELSAVAESARVLEFEPNFRET